jgi:Tol biopolymer transport system component
MELFVMKADGTGPRQVTRNGAANFCPYFHPDGKRILYSSNAGGSPREFDLWLVGEDGTGAERITAAPGFDGFPVFSPDGLLVVWASNRADPESHQTNLFVARWVE